jgi:hypothetical protein
MELASMLAGERFSDRPRSVCPVIGMVLRAYNDALDDDRRQDLYRYAASVVGTRDRRLVGERLERCERFLGRRRASLLRRSRMHAIGRATLAYGREVDADGHRAFLAFLDELTGGDALVAAPAEPCRDRAPS